MTTEQGLFSFNAVAGEALSSYPYHFVKFNATNNTVILIVADTDIPCGVVQNAADVTAVGDPVEVMAIGKTKLELGATLTSGALLQTGAAGGSVGHAIAAKATGYICGQIVDGGDSGDVGSALINCANPWLKA
jgi:hypothetical protein